MQDAELVEQPPYAFHTSKLSLTRGIVCGNLWGSVLLLVTRATYYLVLVRQPPWHYDQGDTNLCNETKSPVPTLVPKSLSSPSACFMHCCNISYTAALGHEGFHPLWQETHYPSGSRRSPAASWTKFLFIGILNAKLHNSLSSTFEWQSWELCTSCAYMLHMRRVTFLGFKHSVNKFFSIGLLRITVVVYMRTRCFPTSWKRLPPILW